MEEDQLYTPVSKRGLSRCLGEKKSDITQSLPRYKIKRKALKTREQTSPVFMQTGKPLTLKIEETEETLKATDFTRSNPSPG
jgi:hypothetical protein